MKRSDSLLTKRELEQRVVELEARNAALRETLRRIADRSVEWYNLPLEATQAVWTDKARAGELIGWELGAAAGFAAAALERMGEG